MEIQQQRKEAKTIRVYAVTVLHNIGRAFSLRYNNGQAIVSKYGWACCHSPQSAEMLALLALLDALSSSEKSAKIELILTSNYLRTRLDQALTKKFKKARGERTHPEREFPEQWPTAANLWVLCGKGITEAQSEYDKHILKEMRHDLKSVLREGAISINGNFCLPQISSDDISAIT